MNADEAIARSVSHNEIVTIESTKDGLEHLLAESDDSALTESVWEFWGEVDGREWRVHAKGPIWWVRDAGQTVPLEARSEKGFV